MNGDILSFFLISVVLPFHGTEAGCQATCENICRERGDKGLNCCTDTNIPTGSATKPLSVYDPYCWDGTCDLRDVSRYVQDLHFLCFHYDRLTEDALYFLRVCKKKYKCRDLVNNCDDSSEEQASGKL